MNFQKHWHKSENNGMLISLGNHLITGQAFYTSLIPRDDPARYQANVNDNSIGRFTTEAEAMQAIEDNIRIRILKILNQVEYGVK